MDSLSAAADARDGHLLPEMGEGCIALILG